MASPSALLSLQHLLSGGLLLLASTSLGSCLPTVPAEATFQIAARKTEDAIEVVRRDDTTLFLVTSPSGIGSATIVLHGGSWPAKTRVRFRYGDGRSFYLLEHFTVKSSETYDLTVSRAGSAGLTPSLEIDLPPEIFRAAPPAIELSWIDAYRR